MIKKTLKLIAFTLLITPFLWFAFIIGIICFPFWASLQYAQVNILWMTSWSLGDTLEIKEMFMGIVSLLYKPYVNMYFNIFKNGY